MEIDNDLAAVARRISEISSGPAIDVANRLTALSKQVYTQSSDAQVRPPAPRAARGKSSASSKLNAVNYGVDPRPLIEAIIERESGFDSNPACQRRRSRADAAHATDGCRVSA